MFLSDPQATGGGSETRPGGGGGTGEKEASRPEAERVSLGGAKQRQAARRSLSVGRTLPPGSAQAETETLFFSSLGSYLQVAAILKDLDSVPWNKQDCGKETA